MKKLLILLTLISTSVFANNGFDNMAIEEIFHRGYSIKAKVSMDNGIVITRGSSSTKSRNCVISLTSEVSKDSILRKGREIEFVRIVKGKRFGDNYDAIDSVKGPVDQIEYLGSVASKPFKTLKEICGHIFTFSVIENTHLQEL